MSTLKYESGKIHLENPEKGTAFSLYKAFAENRGTAVTIDSYLKAFDNNFEQQSDTNDPNKVNAFYAELGAFGEPALEDVA